MINYAGGVAEAEALAGKIEQAGGRAVTAQADVSDPAAVARMFDMADAAFGGVTRCRGLDKFGNGFGRRWLASSQFGNGAK